MSLKPYLFAFKAYKLEFKNKKKFMWHFVDPPRVSCIIWMAPYTSDGQHYFDVHHIIGIAKNRLECLICTKRSNFDTTVRCFENCKLNGRFLKSSTVCLKHEIFWNIWKQSYSLRLNGHWPHVAKSVGQRCSIRMLVSF